MLGQGGMGVVYEAIDAEQGSVVAVKTLLDTRPDRLLAFKQEFRGLQELHHPNLLRLGELFEDDGRWFFTMQKIDGVPFTDFVRSGGLEVPKLRQSLQQLAEGLRALHRAGKVHRDVKPSNTLVEPGGRVVLLDFGLVTDLLHAPRAGRLQGGTRAYMAPEQARGEAGFSADWYAVGVMIYEALTGRLPFLEDDGKMIARQGAEVPARPSSHASDLPSDLEELCMDLLRANPKERPSEYEVVARLRADPRPPVSSRKSGWSDGSFRPFVGRASELEELHRALERSRSQGPVTVFLCGESGVGKSTLIERFCLEIEDRTQIIAGRCYEREFVPFKALDGLVDALAHRLGDIESGVGIELPDLRALARVFPVFAVAGQRAALRDEPEQSPYEARRRAFAVLRNLLFRLAESTALVLVIDDMQWADADSIAVLGDLLGGADPPRLLLIAAARTGTRAAQVPGEFTTLELESLSRSDAAELARLLCRSKAIEGLQPESVAEQAGGHPLFIETLVRHAERPRLEAHGLGEVLAAEVAALPPVAREVVEMVSIAPQPLLPRILTAALQLGLAELHDQVRVLQTRHLIVTRLEGVERCVEPYHDQVRKAVVEGMTVERQVDRHRRLAETLEEHAPERSEALAMHWHAVGDTVRAREHAIRAAHRARQALAFDRAARLFGWALDLYGQDREARWDLWRAYAESLANAGRGADSAAAYRTAARGGPSAHRWNFELCAAEQLLRAGHIDAGLDAMDRLLAVLGMTRPRTVLGAGAMLLRESALGACARAVRPLRSRVTSPTPDLGRRVDACWAVAVGLSQVDPVASSVFQTRYRHLAERLADPNRIALAFCLEAPLAALRGPPATRAHGLLDKVRALCAPGSDPKVEAYRELAAANVEFLLGHWARAVRHGEQAATLFRERCTGVEWEIVTARRIVLECLWHTGRLQDLEPRAWDAWRESNDRGDRYAATQLQTTVLPIVHLKNDDVPSAFAELRQALSTWSRSGTSLQHWQHSQYTALVELYAGRPALALRALDVPGDRVAWAVLSSIKMVRVFTRFVRASAAIGAASRDHRHRRSLLRRALRDVRVLASDGLTPESVALLRGQIEFMQGRREAAAACLSSAATMFAAKDMHLLAAVAAICRARATNVADPLSDHARDWMSGQKVRQPEGFVRLLAPAFAAT